MSHQLPGERTLDHWLFLYSQDSKTLHCPYMAVAASRSPESPTLVGSGVLHFRGLESMSFEMSATGPDIPTALRQVVSRDCNADLPPIDVIVKLVDDYGTQWICRPPLCQHPVRHLSPLV